MNYIIDLGQSVSTYTLFYIVIIYTVFAIVNYLFKSIGLFKLSKTLKKDNNWMVYVPYLNNYYFGLITKNSYYGVIMTVLVALSSSINNLILIALFDAAFLIMYHYSLYFLFKMFTKKYRVYTILSALTLGFMGSIFLFKIRKKRLLRIKVESI